MTAQDLQCSIKAPISAKDAIDRISRVSEWWVKDVEGSARKLGDTFTVRSGKTSVDFKIVEAVPGRRIVWQVTDCNLSWIGNKTEWKGTSVVWEVSSGNGTATVTLTHHGLIPGMECYESCEQGWGFYVGTSLLQFLTEGKGLPDAFSRN